MKQLWTKWYFNILIFFFFLLYFCILARMLFYSVYDELLKEKRKSIFRVKFSFLQLLFIIFPVRQIPVYIFSRCCPHLSSPSVPLSSDQEKPNTTGLNLPVIFQIHDQFRMFLNRFLVASDSRFR